MALLADADPADWPDDLRECILLDQAARCKICDDLYVAAMMLACGHSYCSGCIRSHLSNQAKALEKPSCPECRQLADERDLRPNFSLRALVEQFGTVRPTLVDAVRRPLQQPQPQPAAMDLVAPAPAGCTARSNGKAPMKAFPSASPEATMHRGSGATASTSQRSGAAAAVAAPSSQASALRAPKRRRSAGGRGGGPRYVDSGSDEEGEDGEARDNCPLCGQKVLLKFLAKHADDCARAQERAEAGNRPSTRVPPLPPPTQPAAPPTDALGYRGGGEWRGLEVPPSLVFRLMSVKDARKHLDKYRVPVDGLKTKEDWQARWNAFVQAVNEANDRRVPTTYEAVACRVAKAASAKRGIGGLLAGTVQRGRGELHDEEKQLRAAGANASFEYLVQQLRQRGAKRSRTQSPAVATDHPDPAAPVAAAAAGECASADDVTVMARGWCEAAAAGCVQAGAPASPRQQHQRAAVGGGGSQHAEVEGRATPCPAAGGGFEQQAGGGGPWQRSPRSPSENAPLCGQSLSPTGCRQATGAAATGRNPSGSPRAGRDPVLRPSNSTTQPVAAYAATTCDAVLRQLPPGAACGTTTTVPPPALHATATTPRSCSQEAAAAAAGSGGPAYSFDDGGTLEDFYGDDFVPASPSL